MREERLIVRPFEDFRILDYRSIQEVNEHARAEVIGYIPFEKKDDYMRAGQQMTWVQVVAISGKEETILFYGVIEQLWIEIDNGTCRATLKICSGTQLMDYEEHIRSFQKEDFTYSSLLDTCGQGYENSAKIMTEGKESIIGHFIMQYRETDWEFIKRLASMNHTAVFADCSTKGEKYHFGIPDRGECSDNLPVEYRVVHNMNEYWDKKEHGLVIRPDDTSSYIWISREIPRLGEKMIFDRRERYIWKIKSFTDRNELCHKCYAKAREGFQMVTQYSSSLTGVSLMGNVLEIKEEKVKIELHDDENKQYAGTCWFTFSTIYSSPDGSGWYCMPEVGDFVRLHFPTNQEQEGYVASAYHENDAILRKKPECKFWRNKEGDEIRLSPGRILLTTSGGTFIELSDEEGVNIESEGEVTMRSKGEFNIASENSSIEFSAKKKIILKQGSTVFNLKDDLSMEGSKVLL